MTHPPVLRRVPRRIGALLAIALVAGGAVAALAPLHGAHTSTTLALGPALVHAAETTPPPSKVTDGATSFTLGGAVNNLFAWILAKIASLFAYLLALAALLLDAAVYYTVVKMGDFVSQMHQNIGAAWGILRDIGNIALIFGFLFSGIMVILDTTQYGFGSKLLPMLIVAAILLNFSLLISQVIIDVGNLFATEIYTQINGGKLPDPSQFAGGRYAATNEGISNSIMRKLGLATTYNPATTGDTATKASLLNLNSVLINFLMCILFLIGAFVFASLAFVIVARFVVLILLMIFAPIGFAGLAIPKLSNLANKWWSMLVENTISAPVLLLLLYVALAIITGSAFITALTTGMGADWQGLTTLNGQSFMSGIGVVLVFMVAMGLLLSCVIAAKSMSAFGAQWATKMGGRLSFGLTAYGASATANLAGRAGRYGAQRLAPNSRIARFATRYAFRPMENANLDMLRIPGVKGQAAKLGMQPIAKSPGQRLHQYADWRQKSEVEAARKFSGETVLPRLQTATNEALVTGDYRQVSSILTNMSDKDLETRSVHRALAGNPVAASLLSQSRFEKLQQSEALSDGEKAAVAQARRDGDNPDNAQSRFNMNPAQVYGPTLPNGNPHPFSGMTRGEAIIRGMGGGARAKLSGNVLTKPPAVGSGPGVPPTRRDEVLNLLNAADFRSLMRNEDLTQEQRRVVGEYIDEVVTTHLPLVSAPALLQRQANLRALSATPAFRTFYDLP